MLHLFKPETENREIDKRRTETREPRPENRDPRTETREPRTEKPVPHWSQRVTHEISMKITCYPAATCILASGLCRCCYNQNLLSDPYKHKRVRIKFQKENPRTALTS